MWQIIGDAVKIRFFAYKNMSHSSKLCRAVKGPGNYASGIQIKWLPKQRGATFPAKTAACRFSSFIEGKPIILRDCNIDFSSFGVGAIYTMQLLAHAAVTIDDISKRSFDFIAHSATQTSSRSDFRAIFLAFCHSVTAGPRIFR